MPVTDFSSSSIPERGNLGPIRKSSVPSKGFLGPIKIAEDVWIIRKLFSLGAGQTDGLTWRGLSDRVLGMLGDNPLSHPALSMRENESTKEQILEEVSRVVELLYGKSVPFPLDSTMTIIRKDGKLTLHSVVPLDDELLQEVKHLGEVALFLAPNLQHWLFLESWLKSFPTADVGLVPSAFDEDLMEKMDFLKQHQGNVFLLRENLKQEEIKDLSGKIGLEGKLLKGAPLSLNEFLFYHPDSGTLIASDSFYGGYSDSETPTWFARLWFKLTKSGSFRAARLPIYRTSRVISHGDEEKLVSSVKEILGSWEVNQITFAHGTSPFDKERKVEALGFKESSQRTISDVYLDCWRSGLAAVKG